MRKAYCDKCRKEIKRNLTQHNKNAIGIHFYDNNGTYSHKTYEYCKNCYKNAKKNAVAALLNEDN